jgi:ubiquinone biosynthesis protein
VYLHVLFRAVHIATVLARHAAAHAVGTILVACPWALRVSWLRRAAERAVSGPQRLRAMFEDVGGTFIKFGQMLALQPDIIPLRYCNALFELLDRVAPFPYEVVERTFVEELGKPPEEIFDRIERQPVATASIGQVHVAWLNGRKLAVKVQRPAVRDHFAGDIKLMRVAISVIRTLCLRPLYWMIEPMSEFVAWTDEELDYRREARYMHQLRRNSRENERERVPELLWEFTTARTLVAEFMEGVTLMSYMRAAAAGDDRIQQRLRAGGFEPNRVAANIIDNFLGDVFRHGMFHADLHPANLMILPDNVVGYIDFGITGTISRYSRVNLVALTLAFTRGDLNGMCDAFFRVCSMSRASDVAGFRTKLGRCAETWYQDDAGPRCLRKNFTLVMLDMLTLSRATNIWPARDVIKYIRSAIAIDGLLTRFAPEFNLGRYLEGVCARYLRWHARSTAFTFHGVLDWFEGATAVARDGPVRVTEALDRLSGNTTTPPYRPAAASARLERRELGLAAIVFSTALLISTESSPPDWGWNVFTAEVALMALAGLMLAPAVRKLKEVGNRA